MRVLSFLYTLALFSLVSAVPARRSPHRIVLESRDRLPAGWSKRGGLDKRGVVPVRINLRQNNLERSEELLMDVSDPESPNYGKHHTAKQVADLFAPSKESVDIVKDWLREAGLVPHRVKYNHGHGSLTVNMTVSELEELLHAEYDIYEHDTGALHLACDSYSVPPAVKHHVDFITPTLHFDIQLSKRSSDAPNVVHASVPKTAARIGQPGHSVAQPHKGEVVEDIFTELKNCDKQTTLDCLKALYHIDYVPLAKDENSYGIVEYTPQAYVPSDLDLFARNFSRRAVGYRPKLVSIDGGIVQTNETSFALNGESNLDLQYGINLVYPTPVTLYQVGDIIEGGSFNNFLNGIDASYCGHNDPTQDGIYPDPSNAPGSFKGSETCGIAKPAHVISTSYGYNEADLTPAYEQRQCAEYMKLGMQGVTVVYSSGDYGVAGNGGLCIDPKTGQYAQNGARFNPSFPSTCPWVTSVGATQVNPGSNVFEPEGACEQVIYSGGGFSNVFPIPDYQKGAVGKYFKDHKPSYTAQQYNNSQVTRGYPDISANGANYVVAIEGAFSLVYGTSASAPVVGSIFTLINDARLAAGKGPMGFVNPTLYKNPCALNDITTGGNQGCGTPGFTAVSGWDPVTGLGTPDFMKLLEVFMDQP
ncbi:hypothetical protein BOTBODRAFT_32062 [Botryobasidium botryosum FD-172 SS1]|uniref:tripeptidyl-peptidase II n=1 Tax=Botryobasidium botryosum (strain FD-172 SS1) TaxID=930990 RepID=A0A067MT80_BOTB1|nr:hypothetical protein BOTBODRAFT_32062 [Botryobasidium botryosum FD-172 SS1]